MTISGFLFCLTAVMTGLNTRESKPPPDPGGKPLPNHTRAVTKTVGWVRPYYVWRNKNTILIFHGDDEYGILEGLEEYHIDIGKHVPLDALNRRWQDNPLWLPIALPEEQISQQVRQAQRGGVIWASVSPDGKWIVWRACRPNVGGGPLIWMTISLDGKHWTERHNGLPSPETIGGIAWLHNSRSWIGLLLSNKNPSAGLEYNIYKQGFEYNIYTQLAHRVDFSSPVTLPTGQYSFWPQMAQRPNGHLLLMFKEWGYHINSDMLFADIPWEREKGAPKQWIIHTPPNAFVREVALSPAGNRLIWNLCFVAPDYFRNPNRMMSEAERKQVHSEIWLSKLDGRGMQRLGDLVFDTIPDAPDFFAGSRLLGLQWSPDGKHISYIYDKMLYLVTLP